jgi:ATP-dependent DNA helicase
MIGFPMPKLKEKEPKNINKEEGVELKEGGDKLNKLNLMLTRAKTYSKFLSERLLQNQKPLGQETQNAHPKKVKSQEKVLAALFQGSLHHFQEQGVEWLLSLWENGLNGILADEMGLGKTIEALAFLSILFERGVKGPFLIVVPASTLLQWQAECKKFVPKISVGLHYGPERPKRLSAGMLQTVTLTTYEIALRDYGLFKKFTWKYLIVDEGHRLKNHECKLINALKKLDSENRLLLTGTPLQNNLAELWSLLNFLLPQVPFLLSGD